jgi:DNA polymerase
VAQPTEPGDATPFLPPRRSLRALRDAAADCRGCGLWRAATQTVFGEGAKRSRLMLVGEVPGDQEDRQGHPFVGPAGRELDAALDAVGIDRAEVYITNAVKHFSFEERGKRRIHQRPKRGEIDACRPWLDAELAVVRPAVLGLLGATAGKALFGSSFTLRDVRGAPIESDLAPVVLATAHPASILRQRDDAARHAEREAFRADLATIAGFLNED